MGTIRVLPLALLVVFAGCSTRAGGAHQAQEVRRIVTQAMHEHASAAMRQDIAAAADLFAPDARIMLPSIPDVPSRDSAASLMRSAWSMVRPVDIRFRTEEVYSFGEMAVSIGSYDFLLEPSGQSRIRDRGRFMLLWRREPDGTWRVFRDLTNSVLPAPLPVDN